MGTRSAIVAPNKPLFQGEAKCEAIRHFTNEKETGLS